MVMIVNQKITYFCIAVLVVLCHQTATESGLNCNKAYYGGYGHKGIISSYNFPFDYRHNLTCVNRIFIPPPLANESRKICFLFKSFLLENSSEYCSFDSLIIGESSKNKYCGHGLWQYGLEEKNNSLSIIWSRNFCWKIKSSLTFDVIFSSDNTINGSGFLAHYEVFGSDSPEYFENLPSIPGQAPCLAKEWVCFSDRKCIPMGRVCDGRSDCIDGSDETFAFARCKGRQNLTSCDFSSDGTSIHNFCHLTHEGWEIVSSAESGIQDHTNGSYGHYIKTARIPANLMGPTMHLRQDTSYCLRFWYFLSNSLSGLTLSAYLSYDQAFSQPEWFVTADAVMVQPASRTRSKHGRHHPDWDGSGWRAAEIAVDLKQKPFNFILAAREQDSDVSSADQVADERSRTRQGKAEVAIDDISLVEGGCSGVDMQCNFESSTCGWTSDSMPLKHFSGSIGYDHVWKLRGAEDNTDINFDRSSFDGNGNFAFILFPLQSSSNDERGLLVSPAVSAFQNDHFCFTFWYQRRLKNSCHLKVLTISYDGHLSRDLWTDESDQSNDEGNVSFKGWKLAKINVTSSGPFKIIFDALRSDPSESCLIAIDKIRLERHLCRRACMSYEFRCSDGTCIPREKRCDGKLDCNDEADEDPYTCSPVGPAFQTAKTSLTGFESDTKCSGDSFLCDNNTLCIQRHWVCDSVNDCIDKSDEASCTNYENMDSVPPNFGDQDSKDEDEDEDYHDVDDDDDDDGDGDDGEGAEECSELDFQCTSGDECVSSALVCNGSPDCMDSSDEHNCTTALEFSYPGCPPKFLPCVADERCVTQAMFCDGKSDCPDSSDELEINCIKRPGAVSRMSSVIIGAVCAIVLVLFISIFVVVCFLFAKKRQKRCHGRQRANLPPPTMTSIATIFNSPDSQNHVIQGYHGNQRQVLQSSEESTKLTNDELPPPYNPQFVQQKFPPDSKVSSSFEKLDYDADQLDDGSTSDFVSDEASDLRPQRTMLAKVGNDSRRRGESKDRMSSVGDHIYEEPSGLVALMKSSAPHSQAVSRLSPGPSDRLLIPMQQTRSSVVSPTASSATCQRVSRIRLGTTSLHPRAGSVEAGRAGGGRNAFENRGHATMGRPSHNHQHNTALANRRRSGGIDMERPPSSPATPPPYFGESFASSDPNRAIGGMEMMSRVTSKSSTPAESSNSSNSGSSNARLLPSSASCQQFLTGTNNQFHSRKNAKAAGCKQNRPDGIPLGICYSSDRRQLHDVFSHRLDHHPPHQLRNQKLSSTPSQGTFFQQRNLLTGLGDSITVGPVRSNKPGGLPNGAAAMSCPKQDSFDEATPSSPLLQHHVICGDEFLNPTCV